VNAAVAAAAGFGLALRPEQGLVTPAKLGKLHLMIAQGEKLIEAAKKEIKAYVRDNPGELVVRPDGKVLQFVPQEVERLSKAGVERALGLVEAKRVLDDLRQRGALVKTTELHLKAEDND
jgi:hypothetical protein